MVIFLTIIIAVVFIGAAASGWVRYDKRRLRASFGPELKTVAQDHATPREVDRELRRRKKLHDQLQLRTISAQDQEYYATSWKNLQGEFLDDPSLALTGAEQLVATVLEARGYPGADSEQQLALLSVEHADSLAGYRAAQRTSRRAIDDATAVPTEELRQAMLSYLTLFNELMTDPSEASDQALGSSATSPEHQSQSQEASS
jgi:hypothetical protein